jgi:hypothetical protein
MMNYWKPYENIRREKKKFMVPGSVQQPRVQVSKWTPVGKKKGVRKKEAGL